MELQRLSALLGSDLFSQEPTKKPEAKVEGPGFSEVLQQALSKVEQDQVEASEAAVKLASGETKDIAEVMIASERANLSLSLALQVRNKLLEAYQEIMRMPL